MSAAVQERIRRRVIIEPNSGCWLWSGSLKANGYGLITMREGGRKEAALVHRVAFEAFTGPIPEGLCVCHKCDVRSCCNPEHLFVGTRADNAHDAQRKGRNARGRKCHRAKLSDAMVLEARRRHSDGESQSSLARRFAVHRTTMHQVLTGSGWSWLGGTVVEARSRAKLDETAVRQIRVMREEGQTLLGIAQRFGVSDETVRGIVNGRTWRHVA